MLIALVWWYVYCTLIERMVQVWWRVSLSVKHNKMKQVVSSCKGKGYQNSDLLEYLFGEPLESLLWRDSWMDMLLILWSESSTIVVIFFQNFLGNLLIVQSTKLFSVEFWLGVLTMICYEAYRDTYMKFHFEYLGQTIKRCIAYLRKKRLSEAEDKG